MSTVDVGSACIDRGSSIATRTIIDKANPANGNGTINQVCVYASTNMSGIEFGVFLDNGGNNLTCKGNTDGSNLSATVGDSPKTFIAPTFTAFAVSTGYYAGYYIASGDMEFVSAGGSDVWFSAAAEDHIATEDTYDYSVSANRAVSVYMTEEAAGGIVPQAMFHYLHH